MRFVRKRIEKKIKTRSGERKSYLPRIHCPCPWLVHSTPFPPLPPPMHSRRARQKTTKRHRGPCAVTTCDPCLCTDVPSCTGRASRRRIPPRARRRCGERWCGDQPRRRRHEGKTEWREQPSFFFVLRVVRRRLRRVPGAKSCLEDHE